MKTRSPYEDDPDGFNTADAYIPCHCNESASECHCRACVEHWAWAHAKNLINKGYWRVVEHISCRMCWEDPQSARHLLRLLLPDKKEKP